MKRTYATKKVSEVFDWHLYSYSFIPKMVMFQPSIVLSGWAFSNPEEMNKIAELHNRLGHNVIQYRPADNAFFFFDHGVVENEVSDLKQKVGLPKNFTILLSIL